MPYIPGSMSEAASAAASALGKRRWAGTTRAERVAYAMMLVEARRQKAQRRAHVRKMVAGQRRGKKKAQKKAR